SAASHPTMAAAGKGCHDHRDGNGSCALAHRNPDRSDPLALEKIHAKSDRLLDDSQCRRLFDLPASVGRACAVPEPIAVALAETQGRRERQLLEELAGRNGRWFDLEMDKLDRWAEDRRASLKATLNELDEALKAAKKAARLAPTLPEKLERQREARVLEGKRDDAWRAFDAASRDIDRQKVRSWTRSGGGWSRSWSESLSSPCAGA
ncbi:MAG: hypothetical protein M3461_12310, partial [Pseudomonadota bacterium]|nr:hypothetical protein [Pseudomonadota bacterium]